MSKKKDCNFDFGATVAVDCRNVVLAHIEHVVYSFRNVWQKGVQRQPTAARERWRYKGEEVV